MPFTVRPVPVVVTAAVAFSLIATDPTMAAQPSSRASTAPSAVDARGSQRSQRRRHRARRRGELGRPRRHLGRDQGAAQRRQRSRRCRRHCRCPRSVRAVQRRHRRRRLLRVLRREDADESAPSTDVRRRRWTCRGDAFLDPATGQPYPFTPQLVTSGLSVGVPGTPATWVSALRKWGTRSLAQALRPATRLAQRGFVVDQTFYDQTAANATRFAAITPTADLFLPGGAPPAVGTRFRNPDLAATYRLLAKRGVGPIYRGELGREIVDAVRTPPVADGTTLPVPPGFMKASDLASVRGEGAPPDAQHLPRPRRVRDGTAVERRHDDRRGAEHPRAGTRALRRPSRRHAQVPRGERPGLRRPSRQPRRPRLRRRACTRAAVEGLRR